eukprot:SAG31_NODE_3734_length_3939_cov_1.703906_2_plen_64_part_00
MAMVSKDLPAGINISEYLRIYQNISKYLRISQNISQFAAARVPLHPPVRQLVARVILLTERQA